MNIVVLAGGISTERDVSLTTGLNVFSVNKSDCRESKSIAPNYMMEPSITMNK